MSYANDMVSVALIEASLQQATKHTQLLQENGNDVECLIATLSLAYEQVSAIKADIQREDE